jgi:2,3-bisphosphoglycerate-dependent phosphoglycerate mutase
MGNDSHSPVGSAGAVSKTTTVILTRHAEIDTAHGADPPLNAQGKRRAELLRSMLAESGIDAIYVSHFSRTRETARPLAVSQGRIPIVLDEPKDIAADILSNHPGDTVLVVGHSNTVPETIGILGGGRLPVIDEHEFNNLFVATVFQPDKAAIVKLKYDLMD